MFCPRDENFVSGVCHSPTTNYDLSSAVPPPPQPPLKGRCYFYLAEVRVKDLLRVMLRPFRIGLKDLARVVPLPVWVGLKGLSRVMLLLVSPLLVRFGSVLVPIRLYAAHSLAFV